MKLVAPSQTGDVGKSSIAVNLAAARPKLPKQVIEDLKADFSPVTQTTLS